MQSVLVPALFTPGGGDGSGSLGAGWEAYDATTLTPKAPYQDVRVRNLTVTGTAVITSTTSSTGQFLGGDGTKAAPSYSNTGDTDTGIYFPADNQVGVSCADTVVAAFAVGSLTITGNYLVEADNTRNLGAAGTRIASVFAATVDCSGAADTIGGSLDATTGVRLGSGKVVNWSSTTAFDGTADVGLERDAAGVLEVTDGSTGSGGIKLRNGSGAGSNAAIQINTAYLYGTGGGGTQNLVVYIDSQHIGFFSRGNTPTGFVLGSSRMLGWTATDAVGNGDTAVGRSAAAVVGLYGASASVGSSLTLASDKAVRISSTTDPDGTADLQFARVAANAAWISNPAQSAGTLLVGDVTGASGFAFGYYTAARIQGGSTFSLGWTTGNGNGTIDCVLGRIGANILGVGATAPGTGGVALQMLEMTAPAAAATNGVRIYAEDNGAGKTRLMAIFQSGAAQQIAIEP